MSRTPSGIRLDSRTGSTSRVQTDAVLGEDHLVLIVAVVHQLSADAIADEGQRLAREELASGDERLVIRVGIGRTLRRVEQLGLDRSC